MSELQIKYFKKKTHNNYVSLQRKKLAKKDEKTIKAS